MKFRTSSHSSSVTSWTKSPCAISLPMCRISWAVSLTRVLMIPRSARASIFLTNGPSTTPLSLATASTTERAMRMAARKEWIDWHS